MFFTFFSFVILRSIHRFLLDDEEGDNGDEGDDVIEGDDDDDDGEQDFAETEELQCEA